MVPVTQKKKPDLTLTDEEKQSVCSEEIFDYLPLEDLVSVGLTCKRWYQLAGRYFAKYYPSSYIQFGKNSKGEIVHKVYTNFVAHETNFAPFAERLLFEDDIDTYRFAAANTYPRLKEISFNSCENFSDDHYACIVKMGVLAKVTTIEIIDCNDVFRDSLLNCILPSCNYLKKLAILGTLGREPSLNLDWVNHNYPTLEHLKIEFNNDLSSKMLRQFLRANPQIKKLSAPVDDSLLDAIEMAGIRLDELSCYLYGRTAKNIFMRINALKKSGHIKHFEIETDCEDQIDMNDVNGVPCLSAMKFSCRILPCRNHIVENLASLVNLTKLEFVMDELSPDVAEILSKSLTKLEQFVLGDNLPYLAIPFARRLPTLRVIISEDWDTEQIDLEALNSDRKKLPDAEILHIYLHNQAYCEVRWTSIDLFQDMVHIRRRKD